METCEIEFRGGETLSDAHGCAATWAVPEIAVRRRRQRRRLAALGGEQGARQGQQLFSKTVRQQTIVADAHETPGQDMEEEAAQELDGVEGHDTLDSAVPIIAPAEADFFAVEGGDAVVGYGHAVGVTAEITEDMFRSAEGRLGVDVPVRLAQFFDQMFEPHGIMEISGGPAAIELVVAIEMTKSGKELLTEGVVQYRNGQKEPWVVGRDPALMIWGQSTAGDHAMDVVMATPTPTVP
jgi:hypothetical protein